MSSESERLRIQILPSLLAADFANLGEGVDRAEAAGADQIHLDIMDGHFVPNLSMGPDVVRMARRRTALPLSVHLMITDPGRYADVFADAGATSLLIHIETDCDHRAVLRRIRARGVAPGMTLNPRTPAEAVFPVLAEVDEILCMTVEPGYGGQSFMTEVLPKVQAVRERAAGMDKRLDILVDGGINLDSVAECAARGANLFIAGTALYGAEDMAAAVALMRDRASRAFSWR